VVAAPITQSEKDKRGSVTPQPAKDEQPKKIIRPRQPSSKVRRARGYVNTGDAPRFPTTYRVRVTVIDPQRRPVEDASVWSSVGGEQKKVPGGWEFEIVGSSVPADRKITLFAVGKDSSQGEHNLQMGNEPVYTATIQLHELPNSKDPSKAPESEDSLLATSIEPHEGPLEGKTKIHIMGRGFRPGVRVMFGEQSATSTTFDNERSIYAISPPFESAGAVEVKIINPNNETDTAVFTYLKLQPKWQTISVKLDKIRVRDDGEGVNIVWSFNVRVNGTLVLSESAREFGFHSGDMEKTVTDIKAGSARVKVPDGPITIHVEGHSYGMENQVKREEEINLNDFTESTQIEVIPDVIKGRGDFTLIFKVTKVQ
jgi:hypothetical protein